MEVITFPFGPLGSNMYAVKSDDRALIIDPSVSPDSPSVKNKLDGVNVIAIILTHAHFDHCAYLDEWVTKTGAKAYLASEDVIYLKDPRFNCSYSFDEPLSLCSITCDLGDTLSLEGFPDIRIIKTPGHTPGSVCVFFEKDKLLFTGDTLFAGSVGRSDLPGGDTRTLLTSLKLFKELDDDISVFPGHGDPSGIGIEKKYNPYLSL